MGGGQGHALACLRFLLRCAMGRDRTTRLTHHHYGGNRFPAQSDPRFGSDTASPSGSSDTSELEELTEIWPYAAPISYRAGAERQQGLLPVSGLIVGSVVLGGLVAAGWHSWQFVAPMLQDPAPPQFEEAVRSASSLPQVATSAQPEAKTEREDTTGPMQAGQRGQVTEPLGLYLRSEPNPDAGVLGGVVRGEIVTVLELTSDGEWQRVRRELNDTEGWVKSGYLGPVDPNAPTAVAQTPAPTESTTTASASGTHTVVEPLGLFLRSAPDADADRLGGIVQGEAVTLLSTSSDGQWQRVRRELDGTEGWVKAGNLDAASTGSSQPSSSRRQPSQAAAPATPDPNLRSSSDRGDIFTYSAGSQARVMSPIGLALRAEPGQEGSYVGGIPVNEVVQVLGVSSDGQWQKVRRQGGQEGWVKAGNLGPE